jgi:hypothetical protein
MEFEVTTCEIIEGSIVLEKNDFTKCLATQLEAYGSFK